MPAEIRWKRRGPGRSNTKSARAIDAANFVDMSAVAITGPDQPWWKKIFPFLGWLGSYQRDWIRFDLAAGITLAAYLLPAGLGDASLANLPPEAGLYACLF